MGLKSVPRRSIDGFRVISCSAVPAVLVEGDGSPRLLVSASLEGKIDFSAELLRETEGTRLVYAASRRSVESLAKELVQSNLSMACYHAGLSDQERSKVQPRGQADRRSDDQADIAPACDCEQGLESLILGREGERLCEAQLVARERQFGEDDDVDTRIRGQHREPAVVLEVRRNGASGR